MKVTFALGRGRHAFLSHHLGDLDYYEAYRAFTESIRHYQQLFAFTPELIVHDLHPDYATTRYARDLDHSVPRLAVQHHHAHLASCLADNGLDQPVIGVVFDGAGFGTDGAIWGGEFLIGDFRGFRRAAHFRYVGMPGGEQAIREPWRMAAAYLVDAGEGESLLAKRVPVPALATVRRLIDRKTNCPATSSVGRFFDAVAALAGLRDRVSYEGQAAMEIEWLATEVAAADVAPYDVEIVENTEKDAPLLVDTRATILWSCRRRACGPERGGHRPPVSFDTRRDRWRGLRPLAATIRTGRGRTEWGRLSKRPFHDRGT